MKKIEALRAFLTSALPMLRREPERLHLFADEGTIACALSGGLSYELGYKITGQLWDFAGDPDAVFVPLLDWIAQNQPELLANFKSHSEAITWRAELLDAQKVDLEFMFAVTERVRVQARADGAPGSEAVHLAEPHQEAADVRHWTLHVAGEEVAAWETPAGQLHPWPAS